MDRPARVVLFVAHDDTELLGLLALSITPRLEANTSWAQVVALEAWSGIDVFEERLSLPRWLGPPFHEGVRPACIY